jgi:hypothetical protein
MFGNRKPATQGARMTTATAVAGPGYRATSLIAFGGSRMSTISGYSINSTNGGLTPISGSPFGIPAISLAADYSGDYLYVNEPTGIQVLSIDSTSGALTPSSGLPVPAIGATLLTVVQIPPPEHLFAFRNNYNFSVAAFLAAFYYSRRLPPRMFRVWS